ncbi:hypothetical protein [Rhizobium sp. BG4]|uniref:hypothetical protein n=1 Tax=Rhizobium sp. BG4 TaxID=2613770 RepID=UPI00193D1739|nr:hypothetical protein [Rhizobium sp. BG4]QRM44600.1 hypothetical protein F2982_14805 [Rhizobium sp. BG4]
MDPISSPLVGVGAPVRKPGIEKAFRRVAEVTGTSENGVITVQCTEVMIQFETAVLYCVHSMLRPSVIDCYRWLKAIVWRDHGSHAGLPSESTFRRCVKRERVKIATTEAAARKAARLAKRNSPNLTATF